MLRTKMEEYYFDFFSPLSFNWTEEIIFDGSFKSIKERSQKKGYVNI